MPIVVNIAGQVGQIKLPTTKALWPLFETVINSIQSLENSNVKNKKIEIEALRPMNSQVKMDNYGNKSQEPIHFEAFTVKDNGNGFNNENYSSFLEAYSQLKVKKGCKGIGRFLWLKPFDNVSVESSYIEDGKWHLREFEFKLNGVEPEQNDKLLENEPEQCTIVRLKDFKNPYRDSVAYSLESLAKKDDRTLSPVFYYRELPSNYIKG